MGKAVADVCVRHQGARHRDRQQTRLLYLHHCIMFETFAPLPILHRLGARRRRRVEQCLGELAAQRICHEGRWISDNGDNLLLQPRLIAAAEDEFGNKIRREASRLSQWHAETEKIFGVHPVNKLKLHRSER